MHAIAVMLLSLVLTALSLAGGGIYPWSLQVAAIVLSATALPILLKHQVKREGPNWHSPVWLLFLYICLMLLPLPMFMHNLAPIRADANRAAVTALQNFDACNRFNTSLTCVFSLSRNQAGTLRFLLMFLSCFAAWCIIRQAPRHQRIRLLTILLCIGIVTSIAGILGKWVYPQGDTLYWYIPVPHGRPGPMAGFINRNHYAGFLALLAPVALCATISALQRRRYVLSGASLLATTILSAGVLLSMSRGGTLALLAGILTTAVFLTLQRTRQQWSFICAILCVLAIGAGWMIRQIPDLQTRMTQWRAPATQEAANTRFNAWRDSLEVARAYPILGAGPNAFRTVFPQHRLTSERAARDFAENEYVQWLAETGLVGTLLALAIAWMFLKNLYRQLSVPNAGTLTPWLPAAAGAVAAAGIHAALDFPLRLPLYAITVAALAALAWPQPYRAIHVPAAHACILGLGLLLTILTLPAELRLDSPGMIASAQPQQARRALRAAPTYPIAWRRLSAMLWQSPDAKHREIAVDLLSRAAQYDPNNYILWKTLGERRQALGDNAGANQAFRRVRELRDWVRVPTLPE